MPLELDQRRRDEGAVRVASASPRARWHTRRPLRAHRVDVAPRCRARASSSITGPTSTASVAGSRRSAASRHRAFEHRQRCASAASSCRHSTRSAEQRWPALSNAEATTSATTCSASADESTSIAFWPPVSAISGTGRAVGVDAAGEAVLQQPRDFGRAGEQRRPARARRRPAPRRPSRRGPAAAAAHGAERRPRAARAHHLGGDQRRLLGGLGEHRVAGGERGGDLAGEDREREVPRADADDRAERNDASGVGEIAPRLGRVEAQEVDRLAHFADRVRSRSCRPRARAGRAGAADRPSSASAARSSIAARRAGDAARPARRRRAASLRRARPATSCAATPRAPRPTIVGAVGRIASPARRCVARSARRGQQRRAVHARSRRARSAPASARARLRRRGRGRASCARAAVDRARQGDRRMRPADAPPSLAAMRSTVAHRVLDQRRRSAPSGSAMRLTNDVLAPFSSRRRTEVGEQRLVRADRRVDAARRGRACRRRRCRRPARRAARPCRAGTGTRIAPA